MTRHKHCEQCGLDFEPKQAWEKYCSNECIADHIKLHPPQPNQIPSATPTPPYWPTTAVPMQFQSYWNCGICGKAVPMNETHQHQIYFTTGNP